ncbi:hypothetical protein ABQJ54_15300 [Rhodanobacter sp. Si-c]|uniref:Uncharacterized protein n=1 Tax=Rhodanobacter lycopersici TaxID=3162487 RepID=A0ABV3QIL5_9GAMM
MRGDYALYAPALGYRLSAIRDHWSMHEFASCCARSLAAGGGAPVERDGVRVLQAMHAARRENHAGWLEKYGRESSRLPRVLRFLRGWVDGSRRGEIPRPAPGTATVSDGLDCFPGIVETGCRHVLLATSGMAPDPEHPILRRIYTMSGNAKNAMPGA